MRRIALSNLVVSTTKFVDSRTCKENNFDLSCPRLLDLASWYPSNKIAVFASTFDFCYIWKTLLSCKKTWNSIEVFVTEKSATLGGHGTGAREGLRWRKDQTEWKQARFGDRLRQFSEESNAARNLSAGKLNMIFGFVTFQTDETVAGRSVSYHLREV